MQLLLLIARGLCHRTTLANKSRTDSNKIESFYHTLILRFLVYEYTSNRFGEASKGKHFYLNSLLR
jgi:hypothetical protein